MCHEYGMRWWRSERSEKKPTEETKPDLMGIFAVGQDGERKAAPAVAVGEEKREVEEKELAPAK
jgi:hypothetical protein